MYVKEGPFGKEISKLIRIAFNTREKADYDDFAQAQRENGGGSDCGRGEGHLGCAGISGRHTVNLQQLQGIPCYAVFC
ncbi:MAG: hypothetical protein Q3X94_02620 [Oscillospiraceae bacterium]|nr:hypothetical protein [Oscillospiraceae bacterium]